MANKAEIIIGANAQQFRREMREVNGTLAGLGKQSRESMGIIKAGLAGIAGGAAYAAIAPLVDGVRSLVGQAAGLESTAKSFEVLLGSASQAEKVLQRVRDLGAETPFEFPELADAARKLIAFGTAGDDVHNVLRRIGDVASAVQAPIGEIAEIYGKAQVQGRLFAEDINQLTGRGIPVIQELADQFGVADSQVKKLVEEGKIGFPQLEKAFMSLTAEGGKFHGMMEEQSKTTEGVISNLVDSAKNLAATIGAKLTPAVKEAASAMKAFFDSVDEKKIEKTVKVVGRLVDIMITAKDVLVESIKAGSYDKGVEIAAEKYAARQEKRDEALIKAREALAQKQAEGQRQITVEKEKALYVDEKALALAQKQAEIMHNMAVEQGLADQEHAQRVNQTYYDAAEDLKIAKLRAEYAEAQLSADKEREKVAKEALQTAEDEAEQRRIFLDLANNGMDAADARVQAEEMINAKVRERVALQEKEVEQVRGLSAEQQSRAQEIAESGTGQHSGRAASARRALSWQEKAEISRTRGRIEDAERQEELAKKALERAERQRVREDRDADRRARSVPRPPDSTDAPSASGKSTFEQERADLEKKKAKEEADRNKTAMEAEASKNQSEAQRTSNAIQEINTNLKQHLEVTKGWMEKIKIAS